MHMDRQTAAQFMQAWAEFQECGMSDSSLREILKALERAARASRTVQLHGGTPHRDA